MQKCKISSPSKHKNNVLPHINQMIIEEVMAEQSSYANAFSLLQVRKRLFHHGSHAVFAVVVDAHRQIMALLAFVTEDQSQQPCN